VKGKPKKLTIEGGFETYTDCGPEEATHLFLKLPGPSSLIILPVQIKGRREGTGNWTWNGSTETPDVKPSVLSRMGRNGGIVCHTWINDGQAIFLPDCTHELAGQTLDLLDFD
jgi:hypothetical protein